MNETPYGGWQLIGCRADVLLAALLAVLLTPPPQWRRLDDPERWVCLYIAKGN